MPLHTWLPDAHVEAPTPISMILAGVLLKMGGYGIIRICYPICPHGGYDLAYFVCLLGVVSMVYGAFAALAQKDFKRLVAYSSVSHMGYVVLGLGVWSATAGTGYNPDYWNMGVKGAMFQMIAHGISSAGMFFLVGVVYDRVHHRDLNEFGGLFGRMPVYTALSIGIFFAGLGLARAVRIHRRSARRAVGLELQQRPGRDLGVGRDPDGRRTSCGRSSACIWAPSTRARMAKRLTPSTRRENADCAACCSSWRSCSACSPTRSCCGTWTRPSSGRSTNWPSGPKS